MYKFIALYLEFVLFFYSPKKGIFYNPDFPELNDKAEQLVLVYVTYNDAIVDLLFLLQPEGGLYPLVLLQPWGRRVQLCAQTPTNPAVASFTPKLNKYFNSKLGPALEVYRKDLEASTIQMSDIRINDSITPTTTTTGEQIMTLRVDKFKTNVRIPRGLSKRVHLVQYQRSLTTELRFFFVELVSVDKASNVIVGVAPPSILASQGGLLTREQLPGHAQDTIGYESKSGLMFFNGKSKGNMMGHRCGQGDSMAVEMEVKWSLIKRIHFW